ncbi:hypothetical protein ACWGI1_02350 [Streptomyces sp. NPDC054835]|uniref:hypothetical protein n=1 Tax=Streptomyces exfoliatus TaxID=1905 RepID=UPI000464FA82|nr:hypothetical protein [Streptomyces exfoliatus]
MKTCDRFERIQDDFKKDLTILTNHASEHAGSNSAKRSSRAAQGMRLNMGRALARHFSLCKVCR